MCDKHVHQKVDLGFAMFLYFKGFEKQAVGLRDQPILAEHIRQEQCSSTFVTMTTVRNAFYAHTMNMYIQLKTAMAKQSLHSYVQCTWTFGVVIF